LAEILKKGKREKELQIKKGITAAILNLILTLFLFNIEMEKALEIKQTEEDVS
jgi:hypothetical protein